LNGSQTQEVWIVSFNSADKCVSINRCGSTYKRLEENDKLSGDSDGIMFLRELGPGNLERIRLYPYQAQVTGEIRRNISIGDYQTWELNQFVRG
jgi:hypothetical protein